MPDMATSGIVASVMAKLDANPLSELLPKPELGLFVSACEKAGAARAAAAVAVHISRDKLQPVENMDRQLLHITRLYWSDKAYDEAASVAEIRDQVEPAIGKALATAKAIKEFSKATKAAFMSELRRQKAFKPKLVEQLTADLEKFALLATPLKAAESGSRRHDALKSCCAQLIKFREQLTNASFKATLTPILGTGEATEAFKRPDPQFVLEIAAAIDPAVKFPAVRSALVMLANERSRKESARKEC